MIEEAIILYLLAYTSLTDVVGNRIYPIFNRGNVLPCVVVRQINTEFGHHLGGSDGSAKARIEFSAVAATYRQTLELSEIIRKALQGRRGTLADALELEQGGELQLESGIIMKLEGFDVKSCVLVSAADLPEPPSDGSSEWGYRRALDFSFCYRIVLPDAQN